MWKWGEFGEPRWKCEESVWECKNFSGNMRNAENQGNEKNGVGMQQIRVELCGKLEKNADKGM